ncbi:MAG TPA: caspase family protein [Oculatellaceae cyanobacterium]|jgi:hypothetical protein
MANHACIAIGINRYEFFQPLHYAEADAQVVREFLVESAGWVADRCLLLSDTSTPIEQKLTYPTRENIMGWISEWCQDYLQPGDFLWLFFSGYGVSTGSEDYLMPIDGNPADIANTGIPLRSLLHFVKQQVGQNALVLLDINRSQGVKTGAKVGHQTFLVARELGIPTCLSCQGDQFSYGSTTLRHGLFTVALLEALRYDPAITLESLDQYLRDRTPELSRHHWRPIQTPVSVYKSELSKMLILPKSESTGDLTADNKEIHILTTAYVINKSDAVNSGDADQLTATQVVTPENITFSRTATTPSAQPQFGALVPYQKEQSPQETQIPWWQQLLLWGTGTALVIGMIAGVILRVFHDQQIAQTSDITSNSASVAGVSQASSNPIVAKFDANKSKTASAKRLQANKAILDQAKRLIKSNQASSLGAAIAQAQKIVPGDPLYEQATADINLWSRVILDLASSRAQQGNFAGAIAAAKLIEPNLPVYVESQSAIATWQQLAQQQRTNKIILQAAKKLIVPGQASSYNRAITAAAQVPPNQPVYFQAQKSIKQWSQQIYLIAQSRALEGELQNAIATATLVPPNTPTYQVAQKAINKWKQSQ